MLVVVAEAVAAAPEPVAASVVVNVEMDVPAMLSIDEEADEAAEVPLLITGGSELAEGIATVLSNGFSVPVVAVAYGLMVGVLSKMAQISATELINAAADVSVDVRED